MIKYNIVQATCYLVPVKRPTIARPELFSIKINLFGHSVRLIFDQYNILVANFKLLKYRKVFILFIILFLFYLLLLHLVSNNWTVNPLLIQKFAIILMEIQPIIS